MQPEAQAKGSKEQRSKPIKRRARIACKPCRIRKVRCDVALHGTPCINCKLDDRECTLTPSARKRRYLSPGQNVLKLGSNQQQPQPGPVSLPLVQHSSPPARSPSDSEVQDDLAEPEVLKSVSPATANVVQDIVKLPAEMLDTGRQESLQSGQASPDVETPGPCSDSTLTAGLLVSNTGIPSISEARASSIGSRKNGSETFVHFSHYQCIEAYDLDRIEPSAALLLEEYACFQVPARPILDEFIRHYFLHIHPVLPVMDEVEFLGMFRTKNVTRPCEAQVPLFLFHAILFVASSYVSSASLRKLGFDTAHEAQNEFYKRSRFLFVMCPCSNEAARARCALMLTYHAPLTSDRASAFWLSQAIEYAKRAGAHLYSHIEEGSHEKTFLKRLWWCCILRDRIMALGLRQKLQIKPTDFDFSLPGLDQNDFVDEMRLSMIYDTTTKVILVHLIGVLCELAVVLNGVLTVLDLGTPLKADQVPPSYEDTRRWSRELDRWYERALSRFRVPTSVPGAHESLILFTNMIYIYYKYVLSVSLYLVAICICTRPPFNNTCSSAKAFLGHHRLLLLTVGDWNQDDLDGLRLQAQMGMITSLRSITDNLFELEDMGLSQFLPNTFIGFSAFPFIWYLLDVRSKPVRSSHKNQRGLKVYIDIMRQFRSRCESTDEVLLYIEKTVQYIQTDESLKELSPAFTSPASRSRRETIIAPTLRSFTRGDLADMFLKDPLVFLRISMTVDFSLSRGRFPSEAEFPKQLRAIQEEDEIPDLTFLANMTDNTWWMCLQEVLDAGLGG
ncbi:Zn2-C6 fungal-type DNA-binding domain [Fusarium oxysporum f. sp. vasinfectum]|nr:Zn2-C6 fungal-type DNA-binding domain [Fusarium oxysporum f. sp. vasinfectum]